MVRLKASYIQDNNIQGWGFQFHYGSIKRVASSASFAGNYALNSSMVLYNGGYLNNDIKQKDLFIKSAQFNAEAAD